MQIFEMISMIFYGPFMWMFILAFILRVSYKRRLEYAALPFVAAIDELVKETKWTDVLLYFVICIAAVFAQYMLGAIISSNQMILLWIAIIVLEVVGLDLLAIPIAIGICVLSAMIFPQFGEIAGLIKLGAIYQMVFGILLLFGPKRTYPMMVKLDDEIIGQHVFVNIIPIPILCMSVVYYSPLGLMLMVIYLAFDKKLQKVTVGEYITKRGSYLMISGGVIFLISMAMGSSYILNAALFICLAGAFTLYDMIITKKKDYLYRVKKTGLCVLYVYPDSVAQKMGLMAGDQIKRVNGKLIMTAEALQVMLDDSIPYIWFDIQRGNSNITLEHKDYQEGIRELGSIFVPRHPVKYMLESKQNWLL